MDRWIFRLYNLVLILTVPLVLLIVAIRWRKRVFSTGLDRWNERWGRFDGALLKRLSAPSPGQTTPIWWWVHAVSMGEVKAIETFLRRAPEVAHVRVILSVVTPEALAWATSHQVADEIIAAPFDLPWVVRRVFQAVRPALFVSVESEFWPNLLREAKRSGARVALINGRISHRSYRRYVQFRSIVSALWPLIDLVSVRETQDADRFETLGVARAKLTVSGNLKYDLWTGPAGQTPSLSDRPLVILGSTREGEEACILPALERLRARHPNVQILWAPRHIDRLGEIETLLTSQGIAFLRKSAIPGGMSQRTAVSASHLLWDSMGDLLDGYRQSDVAVIGGSFVDKGGQNPIEPAALEKPVLFGPSMHNFKDTARHLLDERGAEQVTVETLDGRLEALLDNPTERRAMGLRARQAIRAEQGATDRTLALLTALVSSPKEL